MDNLTSLQQDIDNGLCTSISKSKSSSGTKMVVLYKGLVFKMEFGTQGEIQYCKPDDKNINFEQFLDLHGKHYEFSHVLFQETHHLIYVKAIDPRPWMADSIAASDMPFSWCIHRHFTQHNGPLPNLFAELGSKNRNLFVNHYLREAGGDGSNFTKVSYDKLMAHTVSLGELFHTPALRPC